MSKYKDSDQSIISILLSSHLDRYKQIAWVIVAFLAVMIEGYLLPALILTPPSLLIVIIILTVYGLKISLWPNILVLVLFLGLILDLSYLEPVGINMIVALVIVGMVHLWDRVGFLAPQLARLLVVILTIVLVEVLIKAAILYLAGTLFFDISQTIYTVLIRTTLTTLLTWLSLKFVLRK
ncbi:MAG: hypothetical protein WD061_01285 [Candidatus Saccharimonadales bacterium]